MNLPARRLLAYLGLSILMVSGVFWVSAASSAIPETGIDDSIVQNPIAPNDLKPSECAALDLTNIVVGSGTFSGTNNNDLILGSSGADVIEGRGGDDCILGGGQDDDLRGGMSASADTVRDEFNAVSYSNNDGTDNWTNDWVEDDVAGAGPASGNVLITGGELRLDDNPNTGTEPSAAREVRLTGAVTTAIFSFDFRTGPANTAPWDSVAIEVSDNGGASYTVLETIDYITGATSGSKSYDITAYRAVDTMIRFRISGFTEGFNEYFAFDNVQVAYTTGGAPDGDDVLLGGLGDDNLVGGTDTDVCTGGAGSNTYDASCETQN